jgi:hypothetical protein
LLFNSERVALTKEVPVIELIDLKDYENKTEEELDDKTYYYIYNDDERHVLDSEFTDYKTFQGNTNTILNEGITKNKSAIGDLEQLKTENKTTLVVAINEISDYVGKLDGDLGSLLEDNGTIIGIQNSITALETTLAKDYVTIQAITVHDPNKEYINRPTLSTSDAGRWYGYTQDGYERGQTPQLGAVVCFDKAGDSGHVAIVEEILSNGDIITSNSAWGSTYFYMKTYEASNGYNFGSYRFQGFIYNPYASQGKKKKKKKKKHFNFVLFDKRRRDIKYG